MGTSARAAIEIVDGDDTECATSLRRLPKSGSSVGVLERDAHRPVLGHDGIGTLLDLDELFGAERLRFEVERRAVLAEMHAHRGKPEKLGDHRREEMLPGVLLHVIEAAIPIDPSRDSGRAEWGAEEMDDALAFVHHVQNRDVVDPTPVERLTTRSGIEGGAIEVDAGSFTALIDHIRIELAKVGVGVVQSLGHERECLPEILVADERVLSGTQCAGGPRVVARFDPDDHAVATRSSRDPCCSRNPDPRVGQPREVPVNRAGLVRSLNEERALHRAQSPAVFGRDSSDGRHVVREEVELSLAPAGREAMENEEVHSCRLERAQHAGSLSGAVRNDGVAVAHFSNAVGHGTPPGAGSVLPFAPFEGNTTLQKLQ